MTSANPALSSRRFLSTLLLLVSAGCGGASGVLGAAGPGSLADDTAAPGTDTDTGGAGGDDTGQGGDDTGGDPVVWEGAALSILSPRSGDFLPLGEEARFEAAVILADGSRAEFADITWTSDADSAWSLLGDVVEDAALDVGTHTVTATAILPNGDRLAHSIGGLLVQHEDAGTYAGEVRVDVTLEWSGSSYPLGCTGATSIIIDAYGETAVGESACVMVLGSYDLETSYVFDLAADPKAGGLSGAASIDLWLFAYEIDMTASVADGELSGSWSSTEYGELVGELSATRITRDVGSAQ